jgi:D-amino peptidase
MRLFRSVVGFVVAVLLAERGAFAQKSAPAPGGLKVLISADMEGVGGVSTWSIQANSKGREYEKFRELMTKEVNAAIEGAFEAGATEVVVGDSHGDAQNIDVEVLDKRVRLIRAWPRPLGMMQGIDASFGAVVFVGYHAAEGRPNAVLSHSFDGTMEVELDGVTVPEAGFNAAIAGDFGVPVVFLSGDQTICADATKLLGPIETAVVKEATGFYSATMIHPEEAQKRIREGVRRGVERRAEMKPYRIAHPVQLKIRFNSTVTAEVVAMLPGVERPAGNVIVFRGRDMVEVSKFFEAISNVRVS